MSISRIFCLPVWKSNDGTNQDQMQKLKVLYNELIFVRVSGFLPKHWIKFRIKSRDVSKGVKIFPNKKKIRKCSQKVKKIIALSNNFGHKHFSNSKDMTEVILLIVVVFGWGLCQVHCHCTLNRKKPRLDLVSLVRKKTPLFFGIPISNITRKFYGKGEQFGDETLGRKQMKHERLIAAFTWLISPSLHKSSPFLIAFHLFSFQ